MQDKFEPSQFLGFSINIYGIGGDFFSFFNMLPCALDLLDVLLRHLVCIAACLTPTLHFSCCGILESYSSCSVVAVNGIS